MAHNQPQREVAQPEAPPRPVRFDPFDLGILNNRGFLSHYVAESPLTATIKFPSINIWPICEPWDHSELISVATVYAEARYHYGGVANPALKKAIVAGETLSPKLPAVKISSQADARDSISTWIRVGLIDDIFNVLGDYDNEAYIAFKDLPEIRQHFPPNTVPENYPWTPEQIDTITPQRAVFIMMFFAMFLRVSKRQLAIENITLAYCALAKRGQVTDEFCSKIQSSVRDELGINLVLSQPAINALYKSYMTGVNELNAAQVFRNLDLMIPDIALRLKLTLQQASGSGLTLYIIIGRAMRIYYEFPWGRVNTLTSGELRNWQVARAAIGENLYFGFRRDMGEARSTLYKSLGYVARELLVKINGERTLLRYAGLGGNIKNKNALDRLINNFTETYIAAEGIETPEERQVLPPLEELIGNTLFV